MDGRVRYSRPQEVSVLAMDRTCRRAVTCRRVALNACWFSKIEEAMKSTVEEIRQRFDAEANLYTNLDTSKYFVAKSIFVI